MITLYRGDDTGGQLGKNVKIAFHCDDAINMDGVIVHFSLLDVITKEWTNVHDGDILELSITHEQSGRLPLGSLFGKIWGEDQSGRVRTFANRLPIIVTNDLRKVYGSDGLDSQDIHVYSLVGWDAIANKPTLFPSKIELVEGLPEALDGMVKSVNGKTADAAGAVTLTIDSFANDEQLDAINSGIKDYLVPKILTIDESTATKKIVLGDKTFTSFAELTALVQNGATRLKYYVTGATGRPVLYTAHLCDASTIRFDATGTLGETVYTRSIAITKNGDDGIAVSVGALTQVAKKSDVPLVVAPSASAPTGQSADAKVVGSVLKGFFRDDGPPIFYFDEDNRLHGNFISNGVFVEDYFAGNGGAVSCNGVGKLAFQAKTGLLVILDANGNEVARFVKSTDLTDATKLTPVLDADGRVTGYKLGDMASPVLLTDDAKAALFAGEDFITAVKKYGGTQIKEDEKGFYYEVDEEA